MWSKKRKKNLLISIELPNIELFLLISLIMALLNITHYKIFCGRKDICKHFLKNLNKNSQLPEP